MNYSKLAFSVQMLFSCAILVGCQPRSFTPVELAVPKKETTPICQPSAQKILYPSVIKVGEKSQFSINRSNVSWTFFDPVSGESINHQGSPIEVTFLNAGQYLANVTGKNDCDQSEGGEFRFNVLPIPPPPPPPPPPEPPEPLPDLEKAKPFFEVVHSGFGYPIVSEISGCLTTTYDVPTYAVFPICEDRNHLLANSRFYRALFFEINDMSLSSLNTEILAQWIQTANQQFKGISVQSTGHISRDHIQNKLVNSMMGQRLVSILSQISRQTTHSQTVTVKVAVRGLEQFRCQVDLNKNPVEALACLSNTRRYPQEYTSLGFFIDQVFIEW